MEYMTARFEGGSYDGATVPLAAGAWRIVLEGRGHRGDGPTTLEEYERVPGQGVGWALFRLARTIAPGQF